MAFAAGVQDVAAAAGGDKAMAQQLAAEGAGRPGGRYVPSATASWRLNLLRSGDVPDSLLASVKCAFRHPDTHGVISRNFSNICQDTKRMYNLRERKGD